MKAEKSTAYLAISKSNRIHFDKEIEVMKRCLKKYHINLLVFVDKYNFNAQQEKEMMQTAFNEIDNSRLMIAELSKKAIGVGVEVGYAKAKNKPIIYIRKKDKDYSTTVGGSSDYQIEYHDEKQLETELDEIIKIVIDNLLDIKQKK